MLLYGWLLMTSFTPCVVRLILPLEPSSCRPMVSLPFSLITLAEGGKEVNLLTYPFLAFLAGLCIPANSLGFVRSISEKLAITEGHLTLELLTEAFVGFKQSTAALKCLCLEYMAPWFVNLGRFYIGPTTSLTTASLTTTSNSPPPGRGSITSPPSSNGRGSNAQKTTVATSSRSTTHRIQEILRQLIELTLEEREMYPIFQTRVWCMIGSVDGMIGKLIEVFVEHATHHGVDSSPAETLANTIVSLPSVNVRGKIVARLRKVG